LTGCSAATRDFYYERQAFAVLLPAEIVVVTVMGDFRT